jgi:hypothetical protein
VQYDQRLGDWDSAALMGAVLSTEVVKEALSLESQLQHFLAEQEFRSRGDCPWTRDDPQDQQDQQYQRDLTASLSLLLKFLQHTGKDKLLHGPAFGRGIQMGHTATKRDERHWTKNQEVPMDYDEMPRELMGLIAEFLQEHGVWEVPAVPGRGGLGSLLTLAVVYQPDCQVWQQ